MPAYLRFPEASLRSPEVGFPESGYRGRSGIEEGNMFKRNLYVSALIIGSLTFTSCATPRLASPEQDSLAKQFAPPPGKALIYIVRMGTLSLGEAKEIMMPMCDGKAVGVLTSATYAMVEVDPGVHKIVLHGAENTATLEIETEAEKLYFVQAMFTIGWAAPRMSLYRISDENGKFIVGYSKLVASP